MDVSFLERVFDAPGPYATVCADVTHDTESGDTVGDDPLTLGVDQQDMDALGTHGDVVPHDRALLAAAVATRAAVVIAPRAALPDGVPVAAVLRYSDTPTGADQ